MNYRVPKALFNSKALFNPYQYDPFFKTMQWDKEKKLYVPNGKNVFITDEVGVGKTFEVGIILWELLFGNRNLSVQIFCPVKLCANWKSELRENFGYDAINYHDVKEFGQTTIIPYSYFSSGKSNELKQEVKAEKELMETKNTNGINEKVKELPRYDILVLDEAHYIRNDGTLLNCIREHVKNVEVGKPKLKIFMTGTPIFNSENDYNNITELLKYNGQNFETTATLQGEANCYDRILEIKLGGMNEKGELGTEIKCSQVEEDIIEKISKYGRYTGFLKKLSSSSFYSLKKYVEDRDKWKDEEDEEDVLEDEKIDFRDLQETLNKWEPKDDSKLCALINLLNYLKEKDEKKEFKVIIFSHYINTCKYLKEQLLSSYCVYSIDGQTTTKDIEKYKALFGKNSGSTILICSDAAKEGHNLQYCHYLIHYDLPFAPAVIGQRNGRIYRRGQKNTPEVYYMLLDKGYDQRLFGEIIVEKCQIVKNAESEKKISGLNILPTDSADYVEKYVGAFVDDYFETKEKHTNDANPPKKGAIAKEFLKRYFCDSKKYHLDMQMGKETVQEENDYWKLDEAKTLYDNIDKKDESENLKDCIKGLYNISGKDEGLYTVYKTRYDEKIKAFIRNCDDQDVIEVKDNDQDAIEAFRDWGKKYVKEYIGNSNIEDRKYCYDMMTSDSSDLESEDQEDTVSLSDYKKNFVKLKEWEKNGR